MAENLQYRLYNASIDPPGDAWPKIAGQLDRIAEEHLSHKLQQATLEPPANAWENILATLDSTSQPAPVFSINRRWKKWAAAAVAASIVLVAGLLYLRPSRTSADRTASTQQQQTNGSSENNNSSTIDPNSRDNADTQQTANNRPVIASANAPRMVAYMPSTTQRVRYAQVDDAGLVTAHSEETVDVDNAIDQSVSLRPAAYIPPRQYLTVTAPNGQPARISAKLADAVNFVYNNETTANLDMALRSISWQQRFRSWSNKLMNNAAFIPAATNFLDIVELEELLKE